MMLSYDPEVRANILFFFFNSAFRVRTHNWFLFF